MWVRLRRLRQLSERDSNSWSLSADQTVSEVASSRHCAGLPLAMAESIDSFRRLFAIFHSFFALNSPVSSSMHLPRFRRSAIFASYAAFSAAFSASFASFASFASRFFSAAAASASRAACSASSLSKHDSNS
mgnify:CR=1 FL=1